MTTVSGISNYSTASSYSDISSTQRRHRPDPSKMAEDLFSKLDSSGKGYIEQSDLTSALASLSSSSSSSRSSGTSSSDLFSQLDSDGDGKVTKDEFSSSIEKLAESLDSQFNQMRMQGGMPPPRPGDASGANENDSGFTKEELSSQLSEIGSSDSKRASLINNIVQNFDQADTDGDGKVSFKEAMAYDKANPSSATTVSSSLSTSDTSSTESSDAKLFKQLLDLMRAYGSGVSGQSVLGSISSVISTSA